MTHLEWYSTERNMCCRLCNLTDLKANSNVEQCNRWEYAKGKMSNFRFMKKKTKKKHVNVMLTECFSVVDNYE